MDPILEPGSNFLNRTLAGETISEWLFVILVWVLAAVVLLVTQRVLTRRFRRFADHTSNRYDDVIVSLLSGTRSVFLIALGLLIAALVRAVSDDTFTWVGRLVFVIFMLQVVFWGNSLITLYVTRYKEQKLETDSAAVTSVQVLAVVGRILLLATVVLVALDTYGVKITALIAGLGIGGIAIALAVQTILADLFASLSIVLDKPFVIGDFLIVDGYMGAVEHIGIKTTRVRSLSGEQIIFSNGDLLKARVRNYKRMFERRIVFGLGVTYQTPREKLEAVPLMLRGIVEQQDMVRFDRAHFKDFGSSALNFEVVYFVLSPDFNLYMDIQQAVNFNILRQFEEEGIEFAYPTQTLFVEKLPEVATSS